MNCLKLAALVLGIIAITCTFRFLPAEEPEAKPTTSAKSPKLVNSVAGEDGRFIMHEWGTFTTFSGSDGVFLEYRPLAEEHADLPSFVWDRATATGNGSPGFSKRRVFARVRMETPVTYFYTDRVRSVDVRVDFPKGMLTEFFPPARKVLPAFDPKLAFSSGELIGDSSLDWGRIEIIPTDQLLPKTVNAKVRSKLIEDLVSKLLPSSSLNDHYGAARDTDSALVRIERDAAFPRRSESSFQPEPASYFEKFLFYRGVGKFQLPYNATLENDSVALTNNGDLPINSAILIDVEGEKIRAARISSVSAGDSISFPEKELLSEDALAALVQQSLIEEGLYEKEAAAMVNTWRTSWFAENGTRILYLVPPKLTDELIPLHISPSPHESLRVLVGRMEVMSPADEQTMTAAVAESAKQRHKFYANEKRDPKKQFQIPAAILSFGRMTEAALIRVSKIVRDNAVRTEAQTLIRQYQASAKL